MPCALPYALTLANHPRTSPRVSVHTDVSAATRAGGPRIAKESGLTALGKSAVAAAKKGDTSGAQAAIDQVLYRVPRVA